MDRLDYEPDPGADLCIVDVLVGDMNPGSFGRIKGPSTAWIRATGFLKKALIPPGKNEVQEVYSIREDKWIKLSTLITVTLDCVKEHAAPLSCHLLRIVCDQLNPPKISTIYHLILQESEDLSRDVVPMEKFVRIGTAKIDVYRYDQMPSQLHEIDDLLEMGEKVQILLV